LQRLAQLVEQAGVLDRDDGLGSEIRYQLDLLVSERANLLAIDADGADQLVLLKHRHREERPEAAKLHGSYEDRLTLDVSRIGHGIRDMNRLPGRGNAAQPSSRTRSLRPTLPELGKCRRHSEHRRRTPRALLKSKQHAKVGLADPHRVRQHGLEYGFQLAR